MRPDAEGASLGDAEALLFVLRAAGGKTPGGSASALLLALAVLLDETHDDDDARQRAIDATPRLLREQLAALPRLRGTTH